LQPPFDRVLERVREVTGFDLAGYRPALLERRLAARMRALALDSTRDYLSLLLSDAAESTRFIDALGINVSSFFRDPLVFEIIRKRVLPGILQRKREQKSKEIRVWSAGCAAGEEAYSLAILLHMVIGDDVDQWVPRIFATDMDSSALKAARTAVYQRDCFKTTQLGILDEHFIPNGTGFEPRSCIRGMVRFSHHDLTSTGAATPPDSVFGTFDLTLCRNVLIYFSSAAQERVLDHLCKSVATGGYLVLGKSESFIGAREAGFQPLEKGSNIYHKTGYSILDYSS